ncbi:hypothetical protein DFH07DRAFT_948706 [Mycena maculata]|uniref:F-box domain-containing protein n=1 Tax=Mycena maculata TaxID=230809 RepID=A0AAD7KE25_9AGAR|nr:hypothetical protein DFH07DRAFT_948706 [Mycena maculata]
MASQAGDDELKVQLTRMQLALRQYVARRCPSTRLPVELWDIIFEQCVPDTPEPSLINAPLNVSQVCRRWRNIALSNTLIWTALTITCRHTETDQALQSLQRVVQIWLNRSRARHLTVSLAQCDSVKSESLVSLLLETVLVHASHLRSLQVRAPEACLFPLEVPHLYLPVLDHLKIESPWPHLTTPDFTIPVDRAPRLRSLAVLDAFFNATHIAVFDYTQLAELVLLPDSRAPPHMFWTADEALDFIAEAPHLKTLRIAIDDFMPRRSTVATAAGLVSLSLEFRDALSGTSGRPARIGAFFSFLDTPNLHHLALCDRGAPNPILWPLSQFLDTWPQDQFLVYLAATPLRSLHLENLPLYETQVIECLQQVPQLTDLVLEAPAVRGSQRNVGDLLLAALTNRSVPLSGTPIASALRSVEFRHCGKRCTEQALISMVDSRIGALQYLRVHRSAIPSKELAARVARWNVVVDVQYDSSST